MFVAWLRTVGGAIKSDLRFSGQMVYNTFPLPESSEKLRAAVIAAGKGVLEARAEYKGTSLADLYDSVAIPASLVRAHEKLDRAVDRLFGRRDLNSESERLTVLFDNYVEMTANEDEEDIEDIDEDEDVDEEDEDIEGDEE